MRFARYLPSREREGNGQLSLYPQRAADAVFEVYGAHDGRVLSEFIRAEVPWRNARENLESRSGEASGWICWRNARGDPHEGELSRPPIALDDMRREMTAKALEGGPGVPKAPVPEVANATPSMFRASIERQGARWRDALDALAAR